MQVSDFGRFDTPLVLFGGTYSNLQALLALQAVIGTRSAICTGDVVAYGGNPSETVALIRDLGYPVVAGNCERQIAEGADTCGCGFGAGSACDLLSRGWYPFALQSCDAETRAWMAALPDVGIFVQNNRRFAVLHGGATEISRFLWPSSEASDFQREISELETVLGPIDGVVAGHSGIAFHRMIGRHHWINAGAIGLPPHDGRCQTRYAVLEDGDVTFHRLDYDAQSARAAMEAKGLTQGYDQTLTTGIWPSEDILPVELRRQADG